MVRRAHAVRQTLVDLELRVSTSLLESIALAPMGTIWSSSPCMISVGTSILLRSSVKSVSLKALMQS